jgi:FdhD protein
MRTYFHVKGGRLAEVKGEVVREQPLTVHVNGERFLTLLCSPFQLDALVVGYLWMEKVVEDPAEITGLDISEVDGRADVTLSHPVTLPTERILTSGCGGGITFRIDPRLFPRLHSSLRVTPQELAGRLRLYGQATRYQASAASTARRWPTAADPGDGGGRGAPQRGGQGEGPGLLEGIPTADRILLSTGRVSSEMLLKAARRACRWSPPERRRPRWR